MSRWYRMGRRYALYRYARNRGVGGLEAYQLTLTVEIITSIGELIPDVVTEAVEKTIRDTSSNNPFAFPCLPPTKKTELAYPVRDPEPRVPCPHPPFTGVRVELGGDRA